MGHIGQHKLSADYDRHKKSREIPAFSKSLNLKLGTQAQSEAPIVLLYLPNRASNAAVNSWLSGQIGYIEDQSNIVVNIPVRWEV